MENKLHIQDTGTSVEGLALLVSTVHHFARVKRSESVLANEIFIQDNQSTKEDRIAVIFNCFKAALVTFFHNYSA